MSEPNSIILTIEEYLQFIDSLDKDISTAMANHKSYCAQSDNDEISSDVAEESKDHWDKLVSEKEVAVARMVRANVIRPEARFASDVVDGILEGVEN